MHLADSKKYIFEHYVCSCDRQPWSNIFWQVGICVINVDKTRLVPKYILIWCYYTSHFRVFHTWINLTTTGTFQLLIHNYICKNIKIPLTCRFLFSLFKWFPHPAFSISLLLLNSFFIVVLIKHRSTASPKGLLNIHNDSRQLCERS